MTIEVGEPEYLGFQPPEGGESGEIYSVGAVRRSSSGKLVATGKVIVVVPNDQGYDDATMKEMAKQRAIHMISENPDLLTAIAPVHSGRSNVKRDDGDTPVHDGDGFLDPPDDDDNPDEPRRILNPDSPQTGQ